MRISNPQTFLATVQAILQQFSDVSYYKDDTSKCHILDLGLDGTSCNLLQHNYSYLWHEAGIAYLGITLTRSIKGLFKENNISFHQKFSQEAWLYFLPQSPAAKRISLFYNLFQEKHGFVKSLPFIQWEADLGLQ